MSSSYDIAIIGGGIVGLATALHLARQGGIRVVVLEAEDHVGAHQTGHNSGVIHSGLYYKPGSLKAQNCTAGREAMYRFCAEHGIRHERCGKIVVATSEAEVPALNELERRGRANGLTGLTRLTGPMLKDFEPHVAGIDGLWVPTTGIVDFPGVTEKYAELVRQRGGEVRLSHRVSRIANRASEIVIETTRGEIQARNLINCAGLQSDRIARMAGLDPGLQIIPFRGEYYELVPAKHHLVRNLIYPVPDPRFPFLGVHFTRMVKGGVEAGPNAVLAFKREGYTRSSFRGRDVLEMLGFPGFWTLARKYWRMGAGEFHRSFSKPAFVKALQRLLPAIQEEDLAPAGAGVRAQAVEASGALVDDFRIVEAPHMIHVLNAPSPAATASLSIGEHIADRARANFRLS
jgi:L-2-hydroxyglutarate oxidase